MMEKEISETYYHDPNDYTESGKRKSDGISFRDVIKECERDFHRIHSTEYALNLYANSKTMKLLSNSCNAAPFVTYGMDLTQGHAFDAGKDPEANFQMDAHSQYVFVYAIDSAFMTEFDEYGYPCIDEDSEVYPLTLLIDSSMKDGAVRLAVPTLDDDEGEEENVIIDVPKYEYV